MSKAKTQNLANSSAVVRRIVDWHTKNDFLKEQITKLEKLKEFVIFSTVVFLLKSQLIEFELKQLITELDFYSRLTKQARKIRTPRDLDEKRMTLGALKREINNYSFPFLENLKVNLEGLLILRNEFVHSLFNPGSIQELIKRTDRGLVLANKVIRDIEGVNKILDKSYQSRVDL